MGALVPRLVRRVDRLGRLIGPGLLLALTSLGCGPRDHTVESRVRYTPASNPRIGVESVVEGAPDAILAALKASLASSPYRLRTADDSARFLVVELDRSNDAARRASPPERFVDCGRVERSLVVDGSSEAVAYPLAASGHAIEGALVADGDAFERREIERQVDLDARTTIALHPTGGVRTRITLNTRYALKIRTTGSMRVVPRRAGVPEGPESPLEPLELTLRLTTFSPAELDPGPQGFAWSGRMRWPWGAAPDLPSTSENDEPATTPLCRATGALERELLALATAPPHSNAPADSAAHSAATCAPFSATDRRSINTTNTSARASPARNAKTSK